MFYKTLISLSLALALSACTQNANLDNKQALNTRYLETVRDAVFIDDEELIRLMSFPNVLVTSHQAFFTDESLQAIAEVTLNNLRAYEKGLPLENEVKHK